MQVTSLWCTMSCLVYDRTSVGVSPSFVSLKIMQLQRPSWLPQASLIWSPRQAHMNAWGLEEWVCSVQRLGPGHPSNLALSLVHTSGSSRPIVTHGEGREVWILVAVSREPVSVLRPPPCPALPLLPNAGKRVPWGFHLQIWPSFQAHIPPWGRALMTQAWGEGRVSKGG